MRRWVKPVSWQSRRQWAAPRLEGHKSKSSARRKAKKSRGPSKFLHRFYEPNTTLAPVEVTPEVVDEGLQLRTLELLQSAAVMRGQSFMTILEVGVDDGLPYFVTDLNEGEFVQEYVQRRGALPTVTSLALVHQLLQDLGRAEDQGQLLSTVRMDQVLVTTQEEEFLQLRLYDYGLSQPRSEAFGQHSSRFVDEACRLLFLLMTGQTYPGGNPDDFSIIAELPASLRFVIKSVLTSPSAHSISRKSLRDEIREAMCSYVTLVQARNPKLLLVADPSTLPVSHLQTLLLGEIPLKTLFGASFRIQNPELSGCHPFTISAVNVSAEQPVTLHLLPPERIAHQSDFMALPPQVWRQDPARQTNLLHMIGLWKGPDWAFLSEAREPGMSLSALMAKRGSLNPGEVITLLRQIHAGLEQAAETGVQRVDVDPANIQLCVGYDGPVLPRDLERLHQKRLDAWPKFVVKLRLHKTMRSLCKPRLIDLSPWEYNPDEETSGIAARDERHRTFIGLAAYLLTGEGQLREIAEFPSSMPEMAAGYLHECLQWALSGSTVPYPSEFTEKLSHLLTAASAEMNSIEDPLASQEVTSAGFVSDFEEDQAPVDASVDHGRKTLLLAPVSGDLKSLDFHRPSHPQFKFPWLALAATVMLLGALTWMIFGELPDASSGVLTAAPNSLPQVAVRLQEKVAEPPTKPATIPPLEAPPQPVVNKTPVALVEPPTLSPSPPPAVVADHSMSVALKPEASGLTLLGNITREEKQPAEKRVMPSQPQPQLVASANAVSSIPAPDAEPVIRRAILTTPENNKPSRPALPPKEIATNPAPLPAPAMSSTPALVVAATEPPKAPLNPPAAAPSAPPAEVAQLEEVTIRHAIVLTPEEINETLRAQTKARKRTSRRR
ncbi:MAG: hypothetical protein WAW39_29050 [Prosthecobacter sp.]|uniref:hypothetical protein n=1 Tax=Prosthecobacter sp. TaxID=1965333 RepID=UPI003BB1C00E